MADFLELTYKGKNILCLDVAGLKLNDKPEFQKHINYAKEQISKYSPKSVLIITDVTNTGFDAEIVEMFKDYVSHNNPYIKASAVVGVSGLQKVILIGIKTLTGRDFYLAKNIADAQEWLIKQ